MHTPANAARQIGAMEIDIMAGITMPLGTKINVEMMMNIKTLLTISLKMPSKNNERS